MPGVKLAKAYLVNRITSTVIPVQYNPTELSVKKSVPWSADEHDATNIPKQNFKKGDPASISLKLEYDTSGGTGQESDAADVRDVGHFSDLMALTFAVEKGGKTMPPLVDFGWGAGFNDKVGSQFTNFVCVVKSLNISYTRFNPDGKPTRATVQIELVEVDPAKSDYAQHGGGGQAAKAGPPAETEDEREVRMGQGR